jgi:hypothetical protein
MTSALFSWFKRAFDRLRRWIKPLRAREVEELPDILSDDVVYLIGDDGLWWSAAMRCPCGCMETIQLSLIQHDRPSWRAKVDPHGTVTLHPSVWRTKGCRSHFFVRDGRIVWARGNPGR